MQFQISVEGSVRSFSCKDDQPVLLAMTAAGERCMSIGCRSGGCGVCRVQVLSGRYETGVMSHMQIDDAQRLDGYALACKLYPRSDLRLRAVGRLVSAVTTACVAQNLLRLQRHSA